MSAVYTNRLGAGVSAPPGNEPYVHDNSEPSTPAAPLRKVLPVDPLPVTTKPADVTKLAVPLPYMVTLLILGLGMAGGVWRIENRVNVITTTIEYERELDRRREKELDQRFAALEAKIEAAGLRNAALALSQELVKKGR